MTIIQVEGSKQFSKDYHIHCIIWTFSYTCEADIMTSTALFVFYREGKWGSDLAKTVGQINSKSRILTLSIQCQILCLTLYHTACGKVRQKELNFGSLLWPPIPRLSFISVPKQSPWKRRGPQGQCQSLLNHGLESSLEFSIPVWDYHPGPFMGHSEPWLLQQCSFMIPWNLPVVFWG